jgi:hypothetical protein
MLTINITKLTSQRKRKSGRQKYPATSRSALTQRERTSSGGLGRPLSWQTVLHESPAPPLTPPS